MNQSSGSWHFRCTQDKFYYKLIDTSYKVWNNVYNGINLESRGAFADAKVKKYLINIVKANSISFDRTVHGHMCVTNVQ